jgi:drug/metabolite transporter (DMT)-like permease
VTTSRSGAALVGALALVWGSNFLWIKVALDGLSPVQLTFLRMLAGAVVLAVIVRIRAERLPTDRRFLGQITVAALVGNAIPYLLFAIGEQTVDSALAGVLNATTPLWTVVIAVVVGQEPPSDKDPARRTSRRIRRRPADLRTLAAGRRGQ